MLTGVKVADAMTIKPFIVKPGTSIQDAAQLMCDKKVGSLLVAEENVLQGIITEKDFVDKVIAKSMDPKKTRVSDVMVKNVTTVSPNMDLFEAIKVMAKSNVKRLPVVDKNLLVGYLTSKDVLSIQPDLLEILTERFHIREMDRKPAMTEGECNNCGRYTVVKRKFDKLICFDCLYK
ncbi:MAG: CBS domain-containing protein [Candidatus Nanoarchaeia archaeon]